MSRIYEYDDLFFEKRKEVLSEWESGREVNIKEAFNYHNNLADQKKASDVLREAREQNETLIQSLGSYASFQRQLAFYNKLETSGEANFLTLSVDSFSQNKKHKRAKHDYENELSHDRILLDGFPLVVHGVVGCRRLIENNQTPIQVRHEATDARLMAEIAFASGLTDFLGGGVCNTVFNPQASNFEENMTCWEYVDFLVGYYEKNGIKINREIFAPFSGALIPPSLQLSLIIIDGLFAAVHGVRSITLAYNQCGNISQDVAAITVMKGLFCEYLDELGLNLDDFDISTSFHQWSGGFPEDEAKSYSIITLGAMVAAFGNATKVVIKTPNESERMPDEDSFVNGLKATKHMLALAKTQRDSFFSDKVTVEQDIIKESIRSIVDVVLGVNPYNYKSAVTMAFEEGIIDLPFSSLGQNLGLVMPVRDGDGAVRYYDCGKLPLPKDIISYNWDKILNRGKKEERTPSYQMVIDDIYAAGKGLIKWEEG